jgi:hypothetical protein
MQPKKHQLILQLLVNTIPLIGFWFYNWNMFAIIYMYWVEGFIIVLFNSVKMAMAQGIELNEPSKLSVRITSSIKFLIFRIGIFLFYFVFIFVFIALPQNTLHKEIAIENFSIMLFHNSIFNTALLIFFLNQFILFLSNFIISEDYITQPYSKYKILFDSRTIVLHIVIVLGTFGFQYMQKYETVNYRLPALSYVSILFILKSISDIFHYWISDKNEKIS